MRRQGLSVHEIARQLGRSSRTVHQVLTDRGARPMPDRGTPRQTHVAEGAGARRSRRRRRQPPDQGDSGGSQAQARTEFLRASQPAILEAAQEYLHSHPDVAAQLVAGVAGVHLPKGTLDDVVFQEIRDNPTLRRRAGEVFLEEELRGGRTETQIAEEVLDLACRIAEFMVRGLWPSVAREAIKSGELSKVVESLVGASRRTPPGSAGLLTASTATPVPASGGAGNPRSRSGRPRDPNLLRALSPPPSMEELGLTGGTAGPGARGANSSPEKTRRADGVEPAPQPSERSASEPADGSVPVNDATPEGAEDDRDRWRLI